MRTRGDGITGRTALGTSVEPVGYPNRLREHRRAAELTQDQVARRVRNRHLGRWADTPAIRRLDDHLSQLTIEA